MASGSGHQLEEPTQSRGAERRSEVRYPIRLKVRYRTLGPGQSLHGVGQTVDLSSQGFRVVGHYKGIPSEGAQLEAIVEWPVLLNGAIPLELVVLGRVVRSGTFGFAASFQRYDFRTRKTTCESGDLTRE